MAPQRDLPLLKLNTLGMVAGMCGIARSSSFCEREFPAFAATRALAGAAAAAS